MTKIPYALLTERQKVEIELAARRRYMRSIERDKRRQPDDGPLLTRRRNYDDFWAAEERRLGLGELEAEEACDRATNDALEELADLAARADRDEVLSLWHGRLGEER